MHIQKHKSQHVWRDRERHYRTPRGTLPGVTTVLGITTDNAGMRIWKTRVGEAEAKKVCSAAIARGNAIHAAIESFLLGRSVSVPKEYLPWWESVLPFLKTIDNVLLVEGAAWSRHGYAGTIDALVEIGRDLVLIDWKTSQQRKPFRYCTKFKLQCAAYAGALNYTYQKQGLAVRKGKVVIALEGEPAQIIDLSQTQLMSYWGKWLKRLDEYKTIKQAAKECTDQYTNQTK